ncbi:MAG: choice-of-anchor D domain-containing protein, partial [Acidobacteria bacterium]|nr:choice-of-anchor D domain-containing protein [Acidobacteriota bacterium]
MLRRCCRLVLVAWLTSAAGKLALLAQGTAIPQLTPGIISTQAGKYYSTSGGGNFAGDGGPAVNAEMANPEGIAFDAAGNLFIADTYNEVIRVVNRQATSITILGQAILPGNIQTVVGAYTGGGNFSFSGDGGPAGQAGLGSPTGLAFDHQGNLYIADENNDRVRVVNMQSTAITVFGVTVPAGAIQSIAGDSAANGTYSVCPAATNNRGDGCPGTQADVLSPTGLAFDAVGNLYIAQYGDFRVRRIDAATGIVTTVAGTGNIGYSGDGGSALKADLFDPNAVQIDPKGNIYIAEIGSDRVRVVNTQSTPITLYGVTIQPGTIQTVAGSGTAVPFQPGGTSSGHSGDGGPATLAHMFEPNSLWLDAANNLYIADTGNGLLRKVDAQSGIITTIAGFYTTSRPGGYTGDGGPATAAALRGPNYVLLDAAGNLWFSDSGDQVIREVNVSAASVTFPQTYPGSLSPDQSVTLQNIGTGTLTIGSGVVGGANAADFAEGTTCEPALAPGASCTYTFTFAPQVSGALAASFTITESSPSATQSITLNGTGSSTTVAQVGIAPAQLSFGNQAVGTASAAQNLTLSNTGAGALTPSGADASFINIVGAYAGDFSETDDCGTTLAAGASCTVAVTFAPQSAVQASAFLAVEGNARNTPLLVPLAGTGIPAAGGVAGPAPVLQVIPGTISTVVGDGFGAGGVSAGGYAGDGGPAVGARIYGAGALAEDLAGNLFVFDTFNNVIRFVNMQSAPVTVTGVTVQPGTIQTIAGAASAGSGNGGYSGDGGPAIAARLKTPAYGVLDASGNIYFSDFGNDVVRFVNTQPSGVTVNGVAVPPGAIQTVVGLAPGSVVCAQAADAAGDGCPATQAQLKSPREVAFDSAGNLYLVDSCHSVVRAVNMGAAPATIAGVVIQPGQIQIIAGTLNNTAKCNNAYAGDGGPALSAAFNLPAGLALDRAGNIYISDSDNWRIRVVNTQSTPGTFFGVTIPAGTIQTVAGTGTPGYSGDFGPATAASFTIIYGMKLDPAGNLYFADSVNNRIRVIFASTGMIRTVAGTGYGAIQLVNGKPIAGSFTGGYTGDGGIATSAELYYPFDMSVDSLGNLYFGDIYNDVFRQVSATPAGYNFPDTPVNTTSAPQVYTFSNVSGQSISFSGLTVTSNFKQVASGQADCSSSTVLPAGGICQLALAFAPSRVGPLTGTAEATNSAGAQIIPLSGTGTSAGGAVLQALTITPANPSIMTSQTQQFQATGSFSDGGTQDLTASVSWSSSNPSVAVIGAATGLASGANAGTTQITATIGNISSPATTLTVTAAAVTLQSIGITPANPTITLGNTIQFSATGTYSDASSHDISSSVAWSSATQAVATIASNGMATGLTAGAT